ncbi:hypothetical protein NE237_030016 [Protea cynaroides]|uniref:Transposase MuDR plant domain-containing protein n=1 Tax=Protea cynaroides TaxID=273540 RepID=A0A9Q0GWZ6_9MAGN|nr:hypothetical protein NE237_030016 [Protea cynaroides]
MKRIDTDWYGYIDMVYDAYCSVLLSIPNGRTVKFMVKAILPDGVEEILINSDANVVKLFSMYETEDKHIPLYVYAVDVCDLPTTDYTINGYPQSIMTRPSQRQMRRMKLAKNHEIQTSVQKTPIVTNRAASGGRKTNRGPGNVKNSNVAIITIEGNLRWSSKTKATTKTQSIVQGSTSTSSASVDQFSSRSMRKLSLIVDLSSEDEQVPHFESSDDEWKVDKECRVKIIVTLKVRVREMGLEILMSQWMGMRSVRKKKMLFFFSMRKGYEGDIRENDIDQVEPIRMEVCQIFANLYAFREHLKDYGIHEGIEIIWLKNEKYRAIAVCANDECSWRTCINN